MRDISDIPMSINNANTNNIKSSKPPIAKFIIGILSLILFLICWFILVFQIDIGLQFFIVILAAVSLLWLTIWSWD